MEGCLFQNFSGQEMLFLYSFSPFISLDPRLDRRPIFVAESQDSERTFTKIEIKVVTHE